MTLQGRLGMLANAPLDRHSRDLQSHTDTCAEDSVAPGFARN